MVIITICRKLTSFWWWWWWLIKIPFHDLVFFFFGFSSSSKFKFELEANRKKNVMWCIVRKTFVLLLLLLFYFIYFSFLSFSSFSLFSIVSMFASIFRKSELENSFCFKFGWFYFYTLTNGEMLTEKKCDLASLASRREAWLFLCLLSNE